LADSRILTILNFIRCFNTRWELCLLNWLAENGERRRIGWVSASFQSFCCKIYQMRCSLKLLV